MMIFFIQSRQRLRELCRLLGEDSVLIGKDEDKDSGHSSDKDE